MTGEFIPIQLVAGAFALLMFYLSFLHFKRQEFSPRVFTIWAIIWLGFLAVSIFPEIINQFVDDLGVARALDLFTILGFILILAVIFRLFVIITVIERRLETLVRKEALQDLEKQK